MIMLDDVDDFYDLLSSPHPPTQTRTHAAYCKQVSTSLSLARSFARSFSLPPSLSLFTDTFPCAGPLIKVWGMEPSVCVGDATQTLGSIPHTLINNQVQPSTTVCLSIPSW